MKPDRLKEERLGFELLVVLIHLPDPEQQFCFRYRKKQCSVMNLFLSDCEITARDKGVRQS